MTGAFFIERKKKSDLCSLRANEVRPVLACRMTLSADGTIEDNIEFFAATIESKAKLVYDQVSDWLENTGDWQPESEAIAEQVRLALGCLHPRADSSTRASSDRIIIDAVFDPFAPADQ